MSTRLTFKSFNAGQARDADGKWTSGPGKAFGGPHLGSHYGFDESHQGEHAVFAHGGKMYHGKIVGGKHHSDGSGLEHMLVETPGDGVFRVKPEAHHATYGKRMGQRASKHAQARNDGYAV